jgi:hypothetical protein
VAVIAENPIEVLQQVAGGYCLPRCLHVVAELGVADALKDEALDAGALATAVGADPDALGRVLRLLAAHGVFEIDGEMFRHSPASRLLRSDHPQSMRAFARMFGLPIFWATFARMEHAVRTGQPAATQVFPEGFWDYLAQRPDEGRVFNAAMAAKAQGAVAGILSAYDFSRFERIGDIGGGSGHLLRAILADAAPSANGVLFDLPHVVEEASGTDSERLALQAGDFFRDPIPSCDAYLLMEIIHDWGDAESAAILRAIRSAAPDGARLLLIETIVPQDPGPDWSKMLDIHMLTLLGGRQRTAQEYEELLTKAGFALERHIDTGAGISILDAAAT